MQISNERTIEEERAELNRLRKQRKLNPPKKKVEIDPKYKNLCYGFDIKNAKTLIEIDMIYNKAMHFKSTKAKKEIVNLLKKQIIKNKLITDKKVINAYLTVNNY